MTTADDDYDDRRRPNDDNNSRDLIGGRSLPIAIWVRGRWATVVWWHGVNGYDDGDGNAEQDKRFLGVGG